ncbi:MAG: transporter [marine bacterium B5-7]|nr:MAG: transporter [marine bacterium B5-7]
MSILAFALSVTGPIFLVVLLGYTLRRKNIIDGAFVTSASQVVFRVGLPAILFLSIYEGEPPGYQQLRLTIMMILVTLILLGGSALHARIRIASSDDRRVFMQGGFRGNLGVIGLAFCANAYGLSGLSQAAVPMGILTILYNILAVFILGNPVDGRQGGFAWKTCRSIARNPLILGIVAGFAYQATGLPLPALVRDTGDYFASMTLPLALICIGASLDFTTLRSVRGTVTAACIWKLLVSPLIYTSIAWLMGYSGQTLGVVFFLGATPTAAASFIMVKAMRGNESLAAGIVVASTLLSSFTVTIGLYLLRGLDLV